MKRTEFCEQLKAFAEELGYRVEYHEDTSVKESFYLKIYHKSMKIATYNNEVLGIMQEWTDGDVSCWQYTFGDIPSWDQNYVYFNEKYLNKKKDYLRNFDLNMKNFTMKLAMDSIKKDFV